MSARNANTTATATATVTLPADMLDDVIAYLEKMKIAATVTTTTTTTTTVTPTPTTPTDEDADDEGEESVKESEEVRCVDGHKIENGKYSYHLVFTSRHSEWVSEDDCDCEYLINEYLSYAKIRTAYLVCRVSSKSQNQSTAISLEAQESELLTSLPPDHGYGRVKVVRVVGSAYKGIPKKLQIVLEAARAGDGIYVWRVDRLSRNLTQIASTLDELYARGVKVHALQEKLTYNSEQKMDFLQHLLDSQKEAANIGTRVRGALQYMRKRDGRVGTLPYGKMYEKKWGTRNGEPVVERKVVVDNPEEQEILNSILLQLKSKSPEQVAKGLNTQGKYKRGRKWSAGMIKRVPGAPPKMYGGVRKVSKKRN